MPDSGLQSNKKSSTWFGKRSNELVKSLKKSYFSGFSKTFEPVSQKYNVSKDYGLIKIHQNGFPIRQ